MSDRTLAGYAELHCRSNFSFLSAASHPEELVRRAGELGYAALALTDECSVAGVVRAHGEAEVCGLPLIVGSEFRLADGPALVLLAVNRNGYGNLTQLITRARRCTKKGHYRLQRADLAAGVPDCLALWLPDIEPDPEVGRWLAERFAQRAWLAVELHRTGGDGERLSRLRALGRRCGLPLVASGGVLMHEAARRPLLDALTAIRLATPVAQAGTALQPNGERHLRTRERLARFYPADLLAETLRVAGLCRFSLTELRYEYPRELVPSGDTPAAYLRRLTEQGAASRWPRGVPAKVRELLEHELALVGELGYEPYFLTVYDIVRFARARGILCQGRGSAANSAVCYCLGITEVDPARMEMLFERFISKERGEPPDIDVDFEHQRREEVIQYIYAKYGRERAALAASVVTYRPKSAVRDLGKAMGLSLDQVDRLARNLAWWDRQQVAAERLREVGLDPYNPLILRTMQLVHQLLGFPRHLSQHVGGFVISRGPLSRLVPLERAAMEGRTVIQWDKNDLEALGLLKVDCLALGMLSAIRRAFDLINGFRASAAALAKGAGSAGARRLEGAPWGRGRSGWAPPAGEVACRPLALHNVPAEDPAVYRMIQRGDTLGVFQIESRAQMAMLPRLKPACFYDLVIEVAIVRPGPIQGDMVHPYLRRRQGLEPVSYPSAAIEAVLGRTLGVPIFQEQVIKVAIAAAGFSPGEADQVRRSMAAWRRRGGLEQFRERLLNGMSQRGYKREFAQQIYQQILGFGEYGFPESHAASFALLVYVSAWLKCHEPAAFFAALLNSQPMGFYAPAQLVREVRRQGVEVRPVDACRSFWDCTLEVGGQGEAVLRLGLRLIKGLSHQGGERLVQRRGGTGWASVADLARRVGLSRKDLQALAAAGALAGLAGNRHQAVWQVLGLQPPPPLFQGAVESQALPMLPPPGEGESILADYASLGLTLGRHPLALLRPHLGRRRLSSAAVVNATAQGRVVRTAGLVINRQRPASANNVTFVTLEDETGYVNLVVWKRQAERQRTTLLRARLLGVIGEVQCESGVVHVVACRLLDYSALLDGLVTRSRDFQ
jgi:error-prone DNA polymerase